MAEIRRADSDETAAGSRCDPPAARCPTGPRTRPALPAARDVMHVTPPPGPCQGHHMIASTQFIWIPPTAQPTATNVRKALSGLDVCVTRGPRCRGLASMRGLIVPAQLSWCRRGVPPHSRVVLLRRPGPRRVSAGWLVRLIGGAVTWLFHQPTTRGPGANPPGPRTPTPVNNSPLKIDPTLIHNSAVHPGSAGRPGGREGTDFMPASTPAPGPTRPTAPLTYPRPHCEGLEHPKHDCHRVTAQVVLGVAS